MYIYIHFRFKQKTEAQTIFLKPLTVCSSCKWKCVVHPFVDVEANGIYPFANGLNGLNETKWTFLSMPPRKIFYNRASQAATVWRLFHTHHCTIFSFSHLHTHTVMHSISSLAGTKDNFLRQQNASTIILQTRPVHSSVHTLKFPPVKVSSCQLSR